MEQVAMKQAVLEALYQRRSVRDYTDKKVDRPEIEELLKAAVQAPSATNRQPWAFLVIENKELLAKYSERAKTHLLETADARLKSGWYLRKLSDPEFNIFYNAGTLIVICATLPDLGAEKDCCLAGQNLMLAAHAMGLGTCPIGMAMAWLNQPAVKKELGIPEAYKPALSIIVGHPKEIPKSPERLAPKLIS